jgi:hypothetical protein
MEDNQERMLGKVVMTLEFNLENQRSKMFNLNMYLEFAIAVLYAV